MGFATAEASGARRGGFDIGVLLGCVFSFFVGIHPSSSVPRWTSRRASITLVLVHPTLRVLFRRMRMLCPLEPLPRQALLANVAYEFRPRGCTGLRCTSKLSVTLLVQLFQRVISLSLVMLWSDGKSGRTRKPQCATRRLHTQCFSFLN